MLKPQVTFYGTFIWKIIFAVMEYSNAVYLFKKKIDMRSM